MHVINHEWNRSIFVASAMCFVWDTKDTNVSVDLINAYETLRRELIKSVKIAKKFKEELKLANLEKKKLIVRLDESNKKNEKLEQKLADAKAKLENLSNKKKSIFLSRWNVWNLA